MGLFSRRKKCAEQSIKIHFRKLRHWHGPNARVIAHWALQVGDYFYELAAPSTDLANIAVLSAYEEFLKHEGGVAAAAEEPDEDGLEDSDEDELDKTMLETEDGYTEYTTPVLTLKGRKVPLQISRGTDWSNLRNARTFDIPYKTPLEPEVVMERAEHIFNTVFRDGYDFWYYNCQAFVCYLLFSIPLLERNPGWTSQFRLNKKVYPYVISVAIYGLWKTALGEKVEWGKGEGSWRLRDGTFSYNQLIPPRAMKELLEPKKSQNAPAQRIPHLPSKHAEPPRSHAAHVNHQSHHAMKHNMLDTINAAAIAQQQAASQASTQASTLTTNGGGFGNIGGLPFGVGF